MKISKLIAELEKAKGLHGDVEVCAALGMEGYGLDVGGVAFHLAGDVLHDDCDVESARLPRVRLK